MSNKEFETWWCEHGIKFITEKLACFGAWQEKQREIDALKHKLAVTDDGFKAAETLLKNLESENAALKAEVERLRKDANDSECSTLPGVEDWFLAAMKEVK